MEDELAQAKLESEYLRQAILYQKLRPANMYRDFLYNDGDQWVCVGGLEDEKIAEDLYSQTVDARIYGYGESPDEAMDDFDRAWKTGEFQVKI